MLLKISKNSQENTSARVSFLKKRLWHSGTASALYIQGRMPQEKRFIVGRKDIYKGVLEERISQKDNLINYFCLFFLCFSSVYSVYWSFSFNILLRSQNFLSGKTQWEIMGKISIMCVCLCFTYKLILQMWCPSYHLTLWSKLG